MKYIPYNMAVFKMLYIGALFIQFFNWLCCVEGATGSLKPWFLVHDERTH